MRTHVALLRGINVGGRNKVAMADLRGVVTSLGHADVTTYIQSGNVAFAAADPRAGTETMAAALEAAVTEQLAIRTAVVVVSRADLDRVVADNPFPHQPDSKAVHAVFLPVAPDADGTATVAAAVARVRAKGSRDAARVVGRTLYLWTPDGLGRSVLAAELNRGGAHRAPGGSGTARNWATVTTLVGLLGR